MLPDVLHMMTRIMTTTKMTILMTIITLIVHESAEGILPRKTRDNIRLSSSVFFFKIHLIVGLLYFDHAAGHVAVDNRR